MINPKYNKQLVRELVKQSLFGEEKAAKQATRELIKNRYKIRSTSLSAIFEFLDIDDEFRKDTVRYYNFLQLLSLSCWASGAEKHRDFIVEEVFRAVENKNGNVRQAARRLLDDLKLIDIRSKGFKDQRQTELLKFLDIIEEKIEKHKPDKIQTSIRKAPPSVYKTLCLIWHDITSYPTIYESIDIYERQFKKGILLYFEEDFDDDEIRVETYDFDDWQDFLEQHIVCKDIKSAEQLLKKQQKRAEKYLDWALNNLNLYQHKKELIDKISFDKYQSTEFVRKIIAKEISKHDNMGERRLVLARYQKLIRTSNNLNINSIYRSKKGTPFNQTVCWAILDEHNYYNVKKINVNSLLEKIDIIHQEIDNFVDEFIIPDIEDYQKMCREYSYQYYDEKLDLTELSQITHYLANLLLLDQTRSILKKEPRKIVAVLWAICGRYNRTTGLTNKNIAKFAGWKSISSMNSISSRYLYSIKENVDEASLVMINDEDYFEQTEDVIEYYPEMIAGVNNQIEYTDHGEFIDKDHRVGLKYDQIYEQLDVNDELRSIEKLKKLIKEDKNYFDPYILLSRLFNQINDSESAKDIIDQGYKNALNYIKNKQGNSPTRVEWGYIENRHIIRILVFKAFDFWEDNRSDEAYELFKTILKLNPNDNSGVRYPMMAILENMSKVEFDDKFDNNGYLDNSIHEWFDQNLPKHENDFKIWNDYLKEIGY